MEKLTDEALIELYAKDKNQEAFTTLYKRYLPHVLGTAMKYTQSKEDSEDIAIQIFQKLYEKTLEENNIHTFKFWIYTVTKNAAISFLRTKKKENTIPFDDFMENTTFERHDDNHKTIEWTEEMLNPYFKELKNEQAVCLRCFYLQEMSYKQIIEQTGFSFKEVKSYIQNGKRNLKNILKEKYYEHNQ